MEFEYNAFDKNGRPIQGIMTADSMPSIINTLKNTGATSITAIPVQIESKSKSIFGSLFEKQTVTSMEMVVFTRQLGAVLGAGVLLTESIETIATDMENKYFAEILNSVLFHIRSGETFSAALSRHPSIFSAYYVAVVRSGEEIGSLYTTMANLATFMEDYEKMRQKLLSAIRYPTFLMIFVISVVSGIVLFLIPKFKAIFEDAGAKLPLLTRIVVGISEFCLNHFVIVLISLVILTFLSWRALKIFKIRFMCDYYLLNIPIIGKVIRKAMLARVCQTSAMLITGGVGLLTTLSLSSEVVVNLFLKQLIKDVRHSVSVGASLSEAMRPHQDFPRILVKMVAVGEKAGMLGDMFKRMGEYYEQEVDIFLNNLNSLLEPVFIILIGTVVAVVALALYLPIFQLSGTVR
ncbi:MAG: type II secretion system F family protein [Candidatus Omnitrophica bacterium]|nr:type II secretion system F family protein [Candidatus Omnitrophota bacterium]